MVYLCLLTLSERLYKALGTVCCFCSMAEVVDLALPTSPHPKRKGVVKIRRPIAVQKTALASLSPLSTSAPQVSGTVQVTEEPQSSHASTSGPVKIKRPTSKSKSETSTIAPAENTVTLLVEPLGESAASAPQPTKKRKSHKSRDHKSVCRIMRMLSRSFIHIFAEIHNSCK